MKYNDDGTIKEIKVKSFDTLPVGTEVDYDGETVPSGWTEVDEYEYTNVGGGIRTFKKGHMVFVIGGIAVNSTTKTIQLPYTSKYEIHIPTTGYYNQNDNMQGYGFGRMLSGSKDLVLKYNNAVTIACINFAYYTED